MLTDFGEQDGYVGILRGVILTIAPRNPLVDLSHDIPPQNVRAARFCLANAVDYFPPETVYLVVVDPGVGGARRSVAVRCDRGWLVGPDNGIMGGVLARYPATAAVVLTNPLAWLTPHPSATFHGRDIFAPVAARLALGLPLEALGTAIAPTGLFDFPSAPLVGLTLDGRDAITGEIQHIDRFGNLISNILGDRLGGHLQGAIVADRPIPSGKTYGDASPGNLIAMVGSHGFVEIACNGSSAAEWLGVAWGDRVAALWQSSPPAIVRP